MQNSRLTDDDVSRLMAVNSTQRGLENYAAPTHYWAHPKMDRGHVCQITALRKVGGQSVMFIRMDGVTVLKIVRVPSGYQVRAACHHRWQRICDTTEGFNTGIVESIVNGDTYKTVRNARRIGWWILERLARWDADVLDAPSEEVAQVEAEETVEEPAPLIESGHRDHRAVAEVIQNIKEGCDNIWMVGPAGTGKTTIATSIANALGRDMGMLAFSEGTTESHLFGRILPNTDGSWTYKPSRFVEIYEKGGVFLLDELDAADPNVLVGVNAALDNGMLVDPEGNIRKRHPDTVILAAANTYGTGASCEYVGRNQLDSATLDRFVLATVVVDYDPDLERVIANNVLENPIVANAVVEVVETMRRLAAEQGLRKVISMRFTRRACMKIKAGRTMTECLNLLMSGWSESDVKPIMAGIKTTLQTLESNIKRSRAAA